jgi:CRP/FNR family cyclic AMP-dependent transcriptional regulator
VTFFDYPTGESAPAQPAADYLLPYASEADWAALLAFTDTRHLHAGDVLISAGTAERSLYLVVDGNLEVLLPTGRDRWRRAGTVGKGSVLGELAFLDGDARSAMVRTLGDTTVAELTFDEFDRLRAARPDLAFRVAMDLGRILARRLRRNEAASLAGVG